MMDNWTSHNKNWALYSSLVHCISSSDISSPTTEIKYFWAYFYVLWVETTTFSNTDGFKNGLIIKILLEFWTSRKNLFMKKNDEEFIIVLKGIVTATGFLPASDLVPTSSVDIFSLLIENLKIGLFCFMSMQHIYGIDCRCFITPICVSVNKIFFFICWLIIIALEKIIIDSLYTVFSLLVQ